MTQGMFNDMDIKKQLEKIWVNFRFIRRKMQTIESRSFGILSDRDIKNRIDDLFNSPISEDDIQPASVDLHLNHILINLDKETFNLKNEPYHLRPGEFILGSTREFVTIPDDLVAEVDGKSSLGRLGIAVHITAGFIDPSFKGNITLEIKNNSDKTFVLKENMPIGQIVFFTLTSPVERGYGDSTRNNHYQNSKGVILSRYEN